MFTCTLTYAVTQLFSKPTLAFCSTFPVSLFRLSDDLSLANVAGRRKMLKSKFLFFS